MEDVLPRLPVWEEASERGLIVTHCVLGSETISVTALEAEHLRTHWHVGVGV